MMNFISDYLIAKFYHFMTKNIEPRRFSKPYLILLGPEPIIKCVER